MKKKCKKKNYVLFKINEKKKQQHDTPRLRGWMFFINIMKPTLSSHHCIYVYAYMHIYIYYEYTYITWLKLNEFPFSELLDRNERLRGTGNGRMGRREVEK